MEGSGKSTLLAGLHRALEARGLSVIATREPGGTDVGNALRSIFIAPALKVDPVAEALIVSASRAQLVAEVIEPALPRNDVVLCDRFADATLAYQGYGRGIELDTLRELADIATNGRSPDLTLLVDVPLGVSRQRVRERAAATRTGVDRIEREGDDFHGRVRDGYLTIAMQTPRFAVVDGTLAPDALVAAALAKLDERFSA